MATNVIIYLPIVGQDHAHWAVSDDKGNLSSEQSTGTLSEAAAAVEGRRVILVVSGNDVLLSQAKVPGNSLARAMQAVPYALEDQLADDVDTLHFALGSKGRDDIYPVAVIGHDTMDVINQQCAAANLRPSEIVPETLALPTFSGASLNESAWTALLDQEQAVVRLNATNGFATDASMAGIMLNGARLDLPEEVNASIVVYHLDPGEALPPMDDIEVETRNCDSRLSLYASGLATAPRINLMQGEYGPKSEFNKNWKPWRVPAALLAGLFAVLLAGKFVEGNRLKTQVADLDAQITKVFKTALPGEKMQRPEAQMKARLKQLNGGGSDGFINSLSHITAAIADQPQTSVRSISYRGKRFELDINTDAIPTLDLLETDIKKRGGLTMTVQSANREDGGVRSRIRVE